MLGPFLFIMYIKQHTAEPGHQIRLYADDTCLFVDYDDALLAADQLEANLTRIIHVVGKHIYVCQI